MPHKYNAIQNWKKRTKDESTIDLFRCWLVDVGVGFSLPFADHSFCQNNQDSGSKMQSIKTEDVVFTTLETEGATGGSSGSGNDPEQGEAYVLVSLLPQNIKVKFEKHSNFRNKDENLKTAKTFKFKNTENWENKTDFYP